MIKKFFISVKSFWNQKKSTPLLKLLGTYLLILIIPICIGHVYYTKTLSIVYSSTREENNKLFQHISTVLDERIEEISSMANQIASNHFVTSFQGKANPLEYPYTYSIIETQKGLPNYNTTNEFIYNYYIFFDKSHLVLNNQMAYTYSQFYNIHMSFDELSFEDWYEKATERSLNHSGLYEEVSVTLRSNDITSSMRVIPFYCPLTSYGKSDGFIAIFIPKKEIDSLLSSINLNGNGIVYIENKNGDIITHLSEKECNIKEIQTIVNQNHSHNTFPEILLNGEKMVVTTTETSNYTYVAIQSKNVVLKKAHDLKIIQIVVFLLSGLIGILVAFCLAQKNAKSLQEIIDNLSEDENQSGDIFKIIKSSVAELKHNNVGLQNTIEQQLPLLKATFLSRLINSEFNSSEEMNQLCHNISIPTDDHMYCILIIKFDLSYDSYDTLDLTVITTFKHLLKSVLTEIKDDLTYCDIDEQQFAILFSYTSCSKEKFKEHAENLVSLIQSKISTNIVDSIIITGGSIVNQLFLITDSYEKAKTAFKMHSADSHSSILWYKEAENHKITYYFPVEIQNKLMNNVKQGNKQGVKEILELLFNHNFIKLNLSTSLQKLFIYNLLSIIVKLSSQMEVEEKIYVHLIAVIDHIDKYSDLKQIKTIMDLFYLLCDIINEKSAINQNTCITQEILSYIEDHFSNNSISLSSIADHFNMSESYLSYTFKQQHGIKLSVYIENLRIQSAKELLTQTSLTINQISEKIGYLSSNSFCRAFKRVTGINATTYRSENTSL